MVCAKRTLKAVNRFMNYNITTTKPLLNPKLNARLILNYIYRYAFVMYFVGVDMGFLSRLRLCPISINILFYNHLFTLLMIRFINKCIGPTYLVFNAYSPKLRTFVFAYCKFFSISGISLFIVTTL